MSGVPPTSAIRVLGKSMHTLSAGWIFSVTWLWIAEFQQHLLREGVAPPHYALETMISGIVPTALMALAGLAIARWAGRAPHAETERREWWHAFWWSFMPNALLLFTVWVMIRESR